MPTPSDLRSEAKNHRKVFQAAQRDLDAFSAISEALARVDGELIKVSEAEIIRAALTIVSEALASEASPSKGVWHRRVGSHIIKSRVITHELHQLRMADFRQVEQKDRPSRTKPLFEHPLLREKMQS